MINNSALFAHKNPICNIHMQIFVKIHNNFVSKHLSKQVNKS